jgi:hypothetical protein
MHVYHLFVEDRTRKSRISDLEVLKIVGAPKTSCRENLTTKTFHEFHSYLALQIH